MFFEKGRGALWVCIWNQGGGGPKKFGNHCTSLYEYHVVRPICQLQYQLQEQFLNHVTQPLNAVT
jgi:hypothetical protein